MRKLQNNGSDRQTPLFTLTACTEFASGITAVKLLLITYFSIIETCVDVIVCMPAHFVLQFHSPVAVTLASVPSVSAKNPNVQVRSTSHS